MINIILLLLILILLLYINFNVESFNNFDNVKDRMNFVSGDQSINEVLSIVDDGLNKFKTYVNLDKDDIDLESPLLDEYIYTKIISNRDKKNDQIATRLPIIVDNDYGNYNHQLKLLINSKKIKQDFIFNILKNKINYLVGTLENISDVKKQYNLENQHNKSDNSM